MTIQPLGKFECALIRPAAAAAVFSCLRGGSMPIARPPREAEVSAISAWLSEHRAITSVERSRKPVTIDKRTGPGRPAKEGNRYPSGDLRPQAIGGTDEHQAKREALVGPVRDDRTPQRLVKHEALASYPLGVLYARRLILQGDHYAGRRYAALFNLAVRPLTIPSILANLVAGGALSAAVALLAEGADEEVGAQARAEYLAARAVIEARGSHVVSAVDNIAVYEHPPRGTRQLDALRDGLDALHKHFEGEDARSRAAKAA